MFTGITQRKVADQFRVIQAALFQPRLRLRAVQQVLMVEVHHLTQQRLAVIVQVSQILYQMKINRR